MLNNRVETQAPYSRDWRDVYIRNPLITYRWISRAFAIAVGTATALFFVEPFDASYKALSSSLPAAMIAIVGFIITALSILVATGAQATVGAAIKRKRPDLWEQMVYQVSGAAKLAGLIAVLVVLEPFLRTGATQYVAEATVAQVWAGLLTTLSVAMTMLLLRVVWLLERSTASIESDEVKHGPQA